MPRVPSYWVFLVSICLAVFKCQFQFNVLLIISALMHLLVLNLTILGQIPSFFTSTFCPPCHQGGEELGGPAWTEGRSPRCVWIDIHQYPARWGRHYFFCPHLLVPKVPLFRLFIINFASLWSLSKVVFWIAKEESGTTFIHVPILCHSRLEFADEKNLYKICKILAREANVLWRPLLSSSCWPSCPWVVCSWFHRQIPSLLFP